MTEAGHAKKLAGLILEWAVRPIEATDLSSQENIVFVRKVGDTRWEQYQYESLVPLREQDEERQPPFKYMFYCRRSGKRLALLGPTFEISAAIEADLVKKTFVLRMRRVNIAVDPLVKSLVQRPTEYTLSYAYARSPAYGSALKNIIFYGEDIGNAGLFRGALELLTFASCGLRRASGGGTELLRISANGRISFTLRNDSTLLEIERILGFLRNHGYLKRSVFEDELKEDEEEVT